MILSWTVWNFHWKPGLGSYEEMDVYCFDLMSFVSDHVKSGHEDHTFFPEDATRNQVLMAVMDWVMYYQSIFNCTLSPPWPFLNVITISLWSYLQPLLSYITDFGGRKRHVGLTYSWWNHRKRICNDIKSFYDSFWSWIKYGVKTRRSKMSRSSNPWKARGVHPALASTQSATLTQPPASCLATIVRSKEATVYGIIASIYLLYFLHIFDTIASLTRDPLAVSPHTPDFCFNHDFRAHHGASQRTEHPLHVITWHRTTTLYLIAFFLALRYLQDDLWSHPAKWLFQNLRLLYIWFRFLRKWELHTWQMSASISQPPDVIQKCGAVSIIALIKNMVINFKEGFHANCLLLFPREVDFCLELRIRAAL